MTKPTIAVFGGTGRQGGGVIDALLASGQFSVRVVSRDPVGAAAKALNALPQFHTDLDGLGIYFLHIRSPHSDAAPLILTHGWPGSVIEFLKVIPALTDPSRHGGQSQELRACFGKMRAM